MKEGLKKGERRVAFMIYSLNKKNVIENLKTLRNKVLSSEQMFLLNYLVNQQAYRNLKSLTSYKGDLSKKIKAQCDDYAYYFLGSKKYAPWLYVYAMIQGEYNEGWIPLNYYLEHFTYGIDSLVSAQGKFKPSTANLLNTDKLPDLLYINNGFFINPACLNAVSEQEAYNLLFKDNESVIFKSNNSLRGRDICFYTKQNFNIKKVRSQSGVFQRVIEQHSFFNEILPVPGATIRIVTALDNNGKASVRSAYLRLGRLTDKSSHVQSTTNVKVAIDIDSGKLSNLAYLPNWHITKSHPDTNTLFSGLTIPSFSKASTEVALLHDKYPFISIIGWDVSINKDEDVEIMEWNPGNNAIEFHEAVHGPCFKDVLERFLTNKNSSLL